MWKPSNDIKWHIDAICGMPINRSKIEYFFSRDPKEKYEAKNMCFSCPVRADCLKYALEHRRIDGIWGGRDEVDIRRTLSVNYKGEESRRRRFPNCPHCSARPSKLETAVVEMPDGGRWKTARVVYCTECNFSWRSRTSVNAVTAYKAVRAEREKQKRSKKSSEE
jgi:WhiB family redox-sensing transcriptional regulator